MLSTQAVAITLALSLPVAPPTPTEMREQCLASTELVGGNIEREANQPVYWDSLCWHFYYLAKIPKYTWIPPDSP